MDDKPAGSSGLNASADTPAVPPTSGQLSPPAPEAEEPRSRDISPMTNVSTNATQDAPIVTTGLDSAKAPENQAPAAGKPVGSRPNIAGGASNSTPQKRQSFIDRMKGTPDSSKSEEGGKKKKGLFKR